jgi:hypothetical protein
MAPDSVVHCCVGDEVRLAQKPFTIRCESFIMPRFPSGVTARTGSMHYAWIILTSTETEQLSAYTTTSVGVRVLQAAERGEGREPVACVLQRADPPVRPERAAVLHEVVVQHVDGERLLDLHVLDPNHLQQHTCHARQSVAGAERDKTRARGAQEYERRSTWE